MVPLSSHSTLYSRELALELALGPLIILTLRIQVLIFPQTISLFN